MRYPRLADLQHIIDAANDLDAETNKLYEANQAEKARLAAVAEREAEVKSTAIRLQALNDERRDRIAKAEKASVYQQVLRLLDDVKDKGEDIIPAEQRNDDVHRALRNELHRSISTIVAKDIDEEISLITKLDFYPEVERILLGKSPEGATR